MKSLHIKLLPFVFACFGTSALASECDTAIDYLSMPLKAGSDALIVAMEMAYPGLEFIEGQIRLPSGEAFQYEAERNVTAAERLDNATVGDMFTYVYPLDFALEKRKAAFHDPGRVRNEAFFKAIFFDNKKSARASLATIRYKGKKAKANYQVTQKHCVHTQLQAALKEISASSPTYDKYFRKVGGSFNWRKISGTSRLSSHSFGSAIDINTQLGKYWKWAGVKPGKAVNYDNEIPEDIVRAFERFGFIWGGKWHHYDGMHFEYRPELILYSRLISEQ